MIGKKKGSEYKFLLQDSDFKKVYQERHYNKRKVSSQKKFLNMEEQSLAGVLQSTSPQKYCKIHRKAAVAQSFFMKL